VGSRANDPQASLPFTFEEGKHYTLDYVLHPDMVNFVVREITDKAKLAELAEEVAEKQEKSKVKAGAMASYPGSFSSSVADKAKSTYPVLGKDLRAFRYI
jgi:hypothetical protein